MQSPPKTTGMMPTQDHPTRKETLSQGFNCFLVDTVVEAVLPRPARCIASLDVGHRVGVELRQFLQRGEGVVLRLFVRAELELDGQHGLGRPVGTGDSKVFPSSSVTSCRMYSCPVSSGFTASHACTCGSVMAARSKTDL